VDEVLKRSLLTNVIGASPEGATLALEKYSKLSENWAHAQVQESTSRGRVNGIYYTDFSLARTIVKQAVHSKGTSSGSFLEPCVGGGAFLFTFIDEALKDAGISIGNLEAILDRCYIADNDEEAIRNVVEIAPHYFLAKYGLTASLRQANIFIGNSLIDTNDQPQIRDFKNLFSESQGFDFIITNPPYRLLKTDKRFSHETNEVIIQTLSLVNRLGLFKYQRGTPNLYKFFCEAILEDWLANDGVAGLVVPKSLLSDSQSWSLRKLILENFKLDNVITLNEGDQFFKSVGQAFTTFTALKGSQTETIHFSRIKPESGLLQDVSATPLSFYEAHTKQNNILALPPDILALLEHLSSFEAIKGVAGIVNLRGEFDMTLDKHHFSQTDTGLKFLQGSNLKFFGFYPPHLFVDKEILNRPKGQWVSRPRLACQQISNMNQSRRLKWSYIPPGYVLANSCNFVALKEGAPEVQQTKMLFQLLGLLNSSVLNKRFKALSANNHISNHEIDTLPIGILEHPTIEPIGETARLLSGRLDDNCLRQLNEYVNEYFDLEIPVMTDGDE
jgi:Alw26I/Eco31I/Esp3I family type II restriction m6 adenine DNA methyltransferase